MCGSLDHLGDEFLMKNWTLRQLIDFYQHKNDSKTHTNNLGIMLVKKLHLVFLICSKILKSF